MIDHDGTTISIRQQCELLLVNKSGLYYCPAPQGESDYNVELMALIDEEFTRHPFSGVDRMTAYLRKIGRHCGPKRVRRLMRKMGLIAIYPGPNTSKGNKAHKIYPYLLEGVEMVRPNQVWSTDITYIRLAHGFGYLVAIIDWYSRAVLSWRLSNTMDSGFCCEALDEALARYGTPEIFNTDQGSQFTSEAFTGHLAAKNIAISMDGRGRALDNVFVERLWRTVKYEDVYIKGYETMRQAQEGLRIFFEYYNCGRQHKSLNYQHPWDVYIGKGADAA